MSQQGIKIGSQVKVKTARRTRAHIGSSLPGGPSLFAGEVGTVTQVEEVHTSPQGVQVVFSGFSKPDKLGPSFLNVPLFFSSYELEVQ